MKIGIFTALFGEWPLEQVARYVSGLGYEAVELPVWAGSRHLSLEAVLAGQGREVKKMLADHGLSISALSHGVAGQLSLGPLDSSTDAWAPGLSPEQKVAYAVEQLKASARAASELEVPMVTGLIGSHVWDKWYIFPPANEKLYEEGFRCSPSAGTRSWTSTRSTGSSGAWRSTRRASPTTSRPPSRLWRRWTTAPSSASTSTPPTWCGS
jgi:sugar phosphate isomerase/epimerase